MALRQQPAADAVELDRDLDGLAGPYRGVRAAQLHQLVPALATRLAGAHLDDPLADQRLLDGESERNLTARRSLTRHRDRRGRALDLHPSDRHLARRRRRRGWRARLERLVGT